MGQIGTLNEIRPISRKITCRFIATDGMADIATSTLSLWLASW